MQLSAIKGILQTCHNNPCIVELGAHHGEDTFWMIQACPVPPKLVLVEPDLENFRDLLERKYNASMIHGAIADHDGVCDFWVCHSTDGRGSGSIRDPVGHIASKPWMNFERKENYCPCFTLDTLYARPKPQNPKTPKPLLF